MATATLRFYEELNDFLPRQFRKKDREIEFTEPAPVRHLIETLGVPHTEVEVILLNGLSVDLEQPVQDGDRISVYPVFESLDVTPLLRLRDHPLRVTRFAADAHLGKLAGYLRMLGFDTLYRNDWRDSDLASLCMDQHRILLSRDRALLMHKKVSHGCYIRAVSPREQLAYLMRRLDLCRRIAPFTRCMRCNGELRELNSGEVPQNLPPHVLRIRDRFLGCQECGQVYWEGSHYQVMKRWVSRLCAESTA
ncbi:MAG: Mut7-C RNAse domain-containing protein [Sedimenticola sp.]